MSLRVELKHGERGILGGSLITNIGGRAKITIDGSTPIRREKDIMTEEGADTIAKRAYLLVQAMYLSKDPSAHHGAYFSLVQDFVTAAPSTLPFIESINDSIMAGQMYKALKDARALIDYERVLMENARRTSRPPAQAAASGDAPALQD